MFARYSFAPGRAQIAVPPLERIPRPFGFPANVWVLDGPAPTLVDTGFAGGRPALVAALAELGVQPSAVGKVLLTSLLPEAVGNVELFPNATVHAVGAPATVALAEHHAGYRAEIAEVLDGLLGGPDGHPDWDADEADFALDMYFSGAPDALDLVPVGDGQRVVTAAGLLRAIAAPGADPYAAAWFDPESNDLFGGPTACRTPKARIRDPKAFTDALAAISALTPDRILPATGGVERSYTATYRALNLSLSNLVQNMPFALDGPTPVARIAFRDLGYWPRDVVRFAADVLRFKVVLDELVNSGVAGREGSGAWAEYSMERPSRTGH